MSGSIGKKERAFRFLTQSGGLFRCPLCGADMCAAEPFFRCGSGHNFSVSRKGVSTLLGRGQLKKSAVYDRELFENRRRFIAGGYYRAAYEAILALVVRHEKKEGAIRVLLDLGCGEGSHARALRARLAPGKAKLIGMDLSKEAVELAGDYSDDKTFFFVGDVTNIPLREASVDLALDFLSPYQAKETRRVLADDGLFVKVIPGERYLEELRALAGLAAYPGYEEEKLIGNADFRLLARHRVTDVYALDEGARQAASRMTPLTKNILPGGIKSTALPERVTIDLEILLLSK